MLLISSSQFYLVLFGSSWFYLVLIRSIRLLFKVVLTGSNLFLLVRIVSNWVCGGYNLVHICCSSFYLHVTLTNGPELVLNDVDLFLPRSNPFQFVLNCSTSFCLVWLIWNCASWFQLVVTGSTRFWSVLIGSLMSFLICSNQFKLVLLGSSWFFWVLERNWITWF